MRAPAPKAGLAAAAAALLFAAGLATPLAAAGQAVDPLALQADDDPSAAAPEPSGLRLEAWAQASDMRPVAGAAAQPRQQQRLVLDFRREWSWGPDWKLGLSNRLEQVRARQDSGGSDSELRHALREAYASWRWAPGLYLDAGRIQWRNGVASGFNPSDFLKRGAVLDLGTLNPQALRENRLGTVMLRQQWLGDAGSLQLAWIPKLSSAPVGEASAATPRSAMPIKPNPRSPAWERTNGDDAALLRWAPRTPDSWSAEGLAYARAGEPVRWAANLTALLGESWIVYGEWSNGRAALRSQAPTAGHDQELAAGATWTSPWGWAATVERHQATTPGNTDAWFTRLAWDQALGMRDVNLAAFMRVAAQDRSRLWQLDARWHVNDRHSLALIWGGTHGTASSEYGRLPTRRYGMASWSVYF